MLLQIDMIHKLRAAEIAHVQFVFLHAPVLIYMLHQWRVIRERLFAVLAFERVHNHVRLHVFIPVCRFRKHLVADVAFELGGFRKEMDVHVGFLFVNWTESHGAGGIIAFVAVGAQNVLVVGGVVRWGRGDGVVAYCRAGGRGVVRLVVFHYVHAFRFLDDALHLRLLLRCFVGLG